MKRETLNKLLSSDKIKDIPILHIIRIVMVIIEEEDDD